MLNYSIIPAVRKIKIATEVLLLQIENTTILETSYFDKDIQYQIFVNIYNELINSFNLDYELKIAHVFSPSDLMNMILKDK